MKSNVSYAVMDRVASVFDSVDGLDPQLVERALELMKLAKEKDVTLVPHKSAVLAASTYYLACWERHGFPRQPRTWPDGMLKLSEVADMFGVSIPTHAKHRLVVALGWETRVIQTSWLRYWLRQRKR